MPTNEGNPTPARPSDLRSTYRANICSSADPRLLAATSSKSRKRRCHWLDLSEDDNPRPRMQFTEDSTRRPKVNADLPVAMDPSSNAFADDILYERISPRRLSSCADTHRDFSSAPVAPIRVPAD